MNYKQNLHTHSTFADGINTPKELIEIAKRMGFASIGFSEHSYMSYSPDYGMSVETEKDYFDEITALKKEYGDEFPIFCGIEFDMYSGIDISRYNYAIGSVHYLPINGELIGIDRAADEVERVINTYFNGNGIACAEKYYECISQLSEYGNFDIIGHFDIISKCCEQKPLIDVDSKEYLSCAYDAAKALQGKIPYFEVNTGAIARGYRTTPYPSIPLVKEFKRLGFGAVITSDCHNADMLDCGFKDAEELLKACGFAYTHILTKDGFVPEKL